MEILPGLLKKNKSWIESYIKLLAPWWHDIYIPDLDTTTFHISGIDWRVATSQYQVLGFPSEIYNKLGLGELERETILEIGPASGYYGLELSQKNRVTSIERGDRFIRQLSFLKGYFGRRDWTIVKGEFPHRLPAGRYDSILCLGVLYHIKDYAPFCDSLHRLSAGRIYLETLISKNGKTREFRDDREDEGMVFSESDFETRVVKLFQGYRVSRRVDLTGSSNGFYNQLDHIRSTVVLEKKVS